MLEVRAGRAVTIVVVACSLVGACQPGEGRVEDADLVLFNGNVITVDPSIPTAEAIAVRGDRILAVGNDEEIQTLVGPDTERIDLEGATAVPGLIDAHLHFPVLGKRTKQVFLDATSGPDEAIEVVRQQAARAEPGEWITGKGWHTVYWGTTEYPDKASLDRVAPQNPVYLLGMASHAAWVNSMALEAAGITADTADPPGGEIVRDPRSGDPTGMLLEHALDVVRDAIPQGSREEKIADLELSVETALRLGLTGVHDAGVGHEELDLYRELLDAGALRVRLYTMYYVTGANEALDEFLARPPEIGLGGHRLTIRTIKAMADGALGARGAALLEPYSDSPDDIGQVPMPEEQIYEIIYRAAQAGYQPAIHAIGDRGNRLVLDALARLPEHISVVDLRTRLEHAQILAPVDIPRLAPLGVIASMQPIHCTMDMGFAVDRLGTGRMAGAYAWKSLLIAGARVAAGSDTPSFPIKYTNPLWGIHALVTRQDQDGQPPGGFYPGETVSRMEALEMYTIHAAYSAFQEDILGSLTPGKLADITVLSRDILTIPEPEILDTEVVMTIVGGEVEYRR